MVRKRLRKKKRIGEFTEYGFEISFRLKSDISVTAWESLIDRFLEEAIEGNGLLFGGGGDFGNWSGFAVAAESRLSANDLQREAVRRWLEATPEVADVNVSPLHDANEQ